MSAHVTVTARLDGHRHGVACTCGHRDTRRPLTATGAERARQQHQASHTDTLRYGGRTTSTREGGT